MSTEKNKLALKNMPLQDALEKVTRGAAGTPELGLQLARLGIQKYDIRRQEYVISLIEELIRQKAAIEQSMALATRQMNFIRRKFEALEKGEFKLEPNGWIVWDDEELVGIAQS